MTVEVVFTIERRDGPFGAAWFVHANDAELVCRSGGIARGDMSLLAVVLAVVGDVTRQRALHEFRVSSDRRI